MTWRADGDGFDEASRDGRVELVPGGLGGPAIVAWKAAAVRFERDRGAKARDKARKGQKQSHRKNLFPFEGSRVRQMLKD